MDRDEFATVLLPESSVHASSRCRRDDVHVVSAARKATREGGREGCRAVDLRRERVSADDDREWFRILHRLWFGPRTTLDRSAP
jgi:hypothetical protein